MENTKPKLCPKCKKEMYESYGLISNSEFLKCECGFKEEVKRGKPNKEIIKAINRKINEAIN